MTTNEPYLPFSSIRGEGAGGRGADAYYRPGIATTQDNHMRRRFLWLALIALVVVFSTILLSRPIETAYHVYALNRLHARISASATRTKDGFEIIGGNGEFKEQEWHCTRLAALGHFFHAIYELEKLPDTNEIHRTFWNLVQKEFPDRRYVSLTYPTNILEVWDTTRNQAEWEAFVNRCNTEDFANSLVPSRLGQ